MEEGTCFTCGELRINCTCETRPLLCFIKQKKTQGIYEETGYYFKGEFLSRYKQNAINILRERVITAGKGDIEKGKELLSDEWEAVHHEWLKATEAVAKTRKKKQPYFDRMHKVSLKRKIETLNRKIGDLEKRKKIIMEEYNKKINICIEQINEITLKLKEGKKNETRA